MSNRPTFNEVEIKKLVPEQAISLMVNATPQELEMFVKYNWNLDERNRMEVLTAFSYYETLTADERTKVKWALSNLDVSQFMSIIGKYNIKLLDAIESMFDQGNPVIDWLENQLERMKAMLLVFDQLITEGKAYEPNTPIIKSSTKIA